MPCRCDYMEPTKREIEHKLVHNLLFYVVESLRLDSIITDFGRDVDEDTALLCSLIRVMNKNEVNRIVYDGRNPQARKLADWWDKHQERDRIREEAERHQADLEITKRRALEKLTDKERKVLGL